MFMYLKQRTQRKQAARALYDLAAAQALKPHFYARWQVPDSFDGRFEMLILHAFLIWRRLKNEGAAGQRVAQDFFDAMFVQMDRTLRERGVGDLGVPRHVKAMMRAFKGRALAYDAALCDGSDPQALRKALIRNVYGTVVPPKNETLEQMCRYVMQCDAALNGQRRLAFPEPQDEKEETAAKDDHAGMAA